MADDPRVDRLCAHFEGRPGVSIAIVRNGQPTHLKGYGLADRATRRTITPQSAFDLASVSKQFTAVTVMQLAERGKLSLQDPLGKFFPRIVPYARGVRLDRLLTMTSGLPDYADAADVTLTDLLADLEQGRPAFPAGQRYEYLNMNYALLTRVVEKVTAESFGAVLRGAIFEPMKMSRTTFLARAGQSIPGRVVGYRRTRQGQWQVSQNDAPGIGDGNIFSCGQDMARWAIGWLDGLPLLKPRLRQQAWTRATLTSGKRVDYGYGWEIGEGCVYHSGSWDGTSTYIALYPAARLGVVVLSNNEDEAVDLLGERLAALYGQ